jgi:formylglycine-generating enzyme required for sulfatase activity
MAWCAENSDGTTHAVGTRKPNPWGLYDVLGNVQEWVHDWYGPYPARATDPVGPASGSGRVFRGGCWFDPAADVRFTARRRNAPDVRLAFRGFRVARTIL